MVSYKATLLIYKLIIGNKINEREMQYLEYMMCRILIDQQKTLSLRINKLHIFCICFFRKRIV